jgi:hypothetical protein
MLGRGEVNKVKDEMEDLTRKSDQRDIAADGIGAGDNDDDVAGDACRRYEASLESALDGVADPELARHLSQCAGCGAALERARRAAEWLRAAQMPAAGPDNIFVARVMARIRSEQEASTTAGAFWAPVQVLASRIAMAAGMVLLLLSLYVYKSTPRQTSSQQGATAAATGDFPQPPAQPAGKDEVLASLSGSHYGY